MLLLLFYGNYLMTTCTWRSHIINYYNIVLNIVNISVSCSTVWFGSVWHECPWNQWMHMLLSTYSWFVSFPQPNQRDKVRYKLKYGINYGYVIIPKLLTYIHLEDSSFVYSPLSDLMVEVQNLRRLLSREWVWHWKSLMIWR